MRHWAMGMRILGIVAVAGLMFGCEKNQPPEEAVPYDPSIDPPPTNLVVSPDPALLADQSMVASAKAGPAAPTPGDSEDPGAKAVRADMAKIIDAAKAGQWQDIAAHAAPKDADAIKDAAGALAARATADDVLKKAVKTNWGNKEPPASMVQMMEPGPDGGPFLARLPEMSAETLVITPVDPNTVEVKDRTGAKLTFKKSDDKWLISLSDTQVQVYAALAELAKLQAQAAKELTDGISTGIIGAQNADTVIMDKAKNLGESMKRLREAMEADQPKTGTSEGGSGDSSGGSSGDITPPAGDTPAPAVEAAGGNE